jgi:hypothetical protein
MWVFEGLEACTPRRRHTIRPQNGTQLARAGILGRSAAQCIRRSSKPHENRTYHPAQ